MKSQRVSITAKKEQYIVQADKGTGAWYDFAICETADEAWQKLCNNVHDRKWEKHRLVYRLTADAKIWGPK